MTNLATATAQPLDQIDRYVQLAESLLAAGHHPGLDDVRAFYRRNAQLPMAQAASTVRSLHIPLSSIAERAEGTPRDTTGFDAQPALVEALIRSAPRRPRRIVELGCGEGFNTLYLASRHPDIEFVGIDLLPEHVDTANAAPTRTPNATFGVGDFHALPLDAGSVDVMFTVESLCHAVDLTGLFGQVWQALAGGGSLLSVEQLRTPGFDELTPAARNVCEVAERLLTYPGLATITRWVDTAAAAGLAHVETRDLTPAALPKLSRVSRVGERALLRPDPPAEADLKFILTGLLTCWTMGHGGHGMYAVHLSKPDPRP